MIIFSSFVNDNSNE